MTENAAAPGALGFESNCPCCNRIVQVRSDGEHFRWLRHKYTDGWLAGNDCPNSELQWEPQAAGAGFTETKRDTKGWVK